MTNVDFRSWVLPLLFVLGLCGGSGPFLVPVTPKNRGFMIANAMAGGIFLGVCVCVRAPVCCVG